MRRKAKGDGYLKKSLWMLLLLNVLKMYDQILPKIIFAPIIANSLILPS